MSPTNRKMFRISHNETEIPSCDYESHCSEIEKEWAGKRSVTHIRTLLQQSRRNRLEWQKTLKAGQFQPTIKKIPCFEEGSFVSIDVLLCIASPTNIVLVISMPNSLAGCQISVFYYWGYVTIFINSSC